jgi:hypothetical protein
MTGVVDGGSRYPEVMPIEFAEGRGIEEMTMIRNRREFLADVGRGMLVASVGAAVAQDVGLIPIAMAEETDARLTFGAIEPLVALMQETSADRLLPIVIDGLRRGTDLRQYVAAAALANARTFGGEDYDGYHALMALAPAFQMAGELPEAERALPVLKVLVRNSNHILSKGGRSHEALHRVEPSARPAHGALLEATRHEDMDGAERAFASLTKSSLDDAYNELLEVVQDHVNVHRVVLAWRSWALLDLTGKEHAHTLLRQSVRYCVAEDASMRRAKREEPLQVLLPKLLDEHHLLSRPVGTKPLDDAAIDRLAHLIYASPRSTAAGAVAAALGEGFSPESVGEAISLAANALVLHDPGRRTQDTASKPKGSVHGASIGVHASDAANAWRNIARVSNPRNTVASLIVGAYHTAGQSGELNPKPFPLAEQREMVRDVKPAALLAEAEAAIRSNDQMRACALVHRHGELGLPSRRAFDMLLRFAISEDGALHAEKYYRTVTEEFAATRPAFRWRHLAALARVTASEHGFPAPGVAEARQLLKI